MIRRGRAPACTVLLLFGLACGAPGGEPGAGQGSAAAGTRDWALAIHGGAGVPRDSLSPERERAYLDSLERTLRAGVKMLREGVSSLDTVEHVVRLMEDDPLFNAGKGAVFNHDGVNELDASIMDGATLACGAVAGVTTVKNPVSLARLVMERTSHVLLAREGAERFAEESGLEPVEAEYFFTQERWDRLQQALARGRDERGGGTVGAVAVDLQGDLAAATSTGGLSNKLFGRVGDSPIIGAGTYADNTSCAVSATGRGEEFIRHSVARSICALIELRGASLAEAVDRLVHQKLRPGDGGVIAMDSRGHIVMDYNTPGMFRGAADSSGRLEVRIWE